MASFSQSPGPHPGSVIITAEGELDITVRGEFEDWLSRASTGHRQVILDMSAVTFLDTSAMAVLVGQWKKITAAGGILALAGARYRDTKTLWITGLAGRLALYASVAEAATALTAGSPSSGPAAPS